MAARLEKSFTFTMNPYILWIIGLSLVLATIIFAIPPTSLFIIFIACIVAAGIQYLCCSFYLSKKTSFFSSLSIWVGVLLYILSALTGMNIVILCALIVALGIYLYR